MPVTKQDFLICLKEYEHIALQYKKALKDNIATPGAIGRLKRKIDKLKKKLENLEKHV